MKREDLISKIDLAVILTLFTGLCYGITYLFYAGQFFYYGIPLYFIQIEAKEVFFTVLLFSPIFFNIISSIRLDSPLKSKDSDSKEKGIKNLRLESKEIKKKLDEIDDGIAKEETDVNTLKTRLENVLTWKIQSKELKKEIEAIEEEINKSEVIIKRSKINSTKLKEQINIVDQSIDIVKRKQIKNVTVFILIMGIIITGLFFFIRDVTYIVVIFMILQISLLLLVTWLNKKRKYRILIYVITLFLILFPFSIGIYGSYTKENFLVFEENNKQYIVLTIYKDQFLYVPIDRKANEYQQKFNIIDIKDVKNFSQESIGQIQKQNISHYENQYKQKEDKK